MRKCFLFTLFYFPDNFLSATYTLFIILFYLHIYMQFQCFQVSTQFEQALDCVGSFHVLTVLFLDPTLP